MTNTTYYYLRRRAHAFLLCQALRLLAFNLVSSRAAEREVTF